MSALNFPLIQLTVSVLLLEVRRRVAGSVMTISVYASKAPMLPKHARQSWIASKE